MLLAAEFGVKVSQVLGHFDDLDIALIYFIHHGCRIRRDDNDPIYTLEELAAKRDTIKLPLSIYWSDEALQSMGVHFYSVDTMLGSEGYDTGFDEDNPIELVQVEVANKLVNGYDDD